MSRAERRRHEREQLYKQRRIRTLQSYIHQMRQEGLLPTPKPTLLQKIKGLFKKWQ